MSVPYVYVRPITEKEWRELWKPPENPGWLDRLPPGVKFLIVLAEIALIVWVSILFCGF